MESSLRQKLRSLHEKCKEYQAMEACSDSMEDIIAKAEQSAFGLKPENSLKEFVRSHEGEVHIVSFEDFVLLKEENINILENSIYVHDTNAETGIKKFDIVLPANSSSYERRFTLAHEYGHYILHQGKGYCLAYRLKNDSNELVEQQADWFAIGFLLPETSFREEYERLRGSYSDLSLYFRVPRSVIVKRVEMLHLDSTS